MGKNFILFKNDLNGRFAKVSGQELNANERRISDYYRDITRTCNTFSFTALLDAAIDLLLTHPHVAVFVDEVFKI